MVVTMLASMVTTILLGRALPTESFGEFTLFRNLALLGSSLAVIGMHNSYIKLNLNRVLEPLFYFKMLSVILISGTMITLIFRIIYYDNNIYPIYLLLAIVSGSIILVIAAKHRLEKKFLIAQIFQSGWKLTAFIVITVILFSPINNRVSLLTAILAFSMFGFAVYFFKYIGLTPFFPVPNSQIINTIKIKEFIIYGGLFALVDSTQMIYGRIDKILIPIYMGNVELGYYVAVGLIFTTSFTMIGSAVGAVLYPTLTQKKKVNWNRTLLMILVGLIAGILFLAFTGGTFVHLVYSSKYDRINNTYFILMFTLLGALQYLHPIAHYIIFGKSREKDLIIYLLATLIVVLLTITAFIIINSYMKLNLELALAIIVISWSLKILVSVLLIFRQYYTLPKIQV